MTAPTTGSLCTGYGGLDRAVDAVLGDTRTAWVSEFDEYAAVVTARHFDAPNLGDLTIVDWGEVEPVDVLTAGYPCQPFSQAGRRKGTDDPRHIWPHIASAIGVLRPGLVVLENVAGHLALGFDVVLGDLAALGFDAEWCLVRASDVGACHRRARLFIVATDARGERGRRDPGAAPGTQERTGRSAANEGDGALSVRQDAADPGGMGWGPRAGLRPNEPGGERRGRSGDHAGAPVANPGGERLDGWTQVQGVGRQAAERGEAGRDAGDGAVAWGEYEPAIRRHEAAIGRVAPAPTENGRLSPLFVEWMMMLPAGWVTDCDLTRAQALKILGNGVVPPQAAYAIAGLLDRLAAWENAA